MSETTADSRKSRREADPLISPKWKKRTLSEKSYWKRNANGQNEPTGKRKLSLKKELKEAAKTDPKAAENGKP